MVAGTAVAMYLRLLRGRHSYHSFCVQQLDSCQCCWMHCCVGCNFYYRCTKHHCLALLTAHSILRCTELPPFKSHGPGSQMIYSPALMSSLDFTISAAFCPLVIAPQRQWRPQEDSRRRFWKNNGLPTTLCALMMNDHVCCLVIYACVQSNLWTSPPWLWSKLPSCGRACQSIITLLVGCFNGPFHRTAGMCATSKADTHMAHDMPPCTLMMLHHSRLACCASVVWLTVVLQPYCTTANSGVAEQSRIAHTCPELQSYLDGCNRQKCPGLPRSEQMRSRTSALFQLCDCGLM